VPQCWGLGLPLFSGEESYLSDSLVFAQEVVNLGGMNFCDAISLHAYPWGHYNGTVQTAYNTSLSLYRQMTGGKEVWITETGQKSAPDSASVFTPQEQADYLNASYSFFESQNASAIFGMNSLMAVINLSFLDCTATILQPPKLPYSLILIW
jgi:hypothetical protein